MKSKLHSYSNASPESIEEDVTMNLKLGRAETMDVASLAELLRETAEHHENFEKTHAEHHWWDWYAAYLNARLNDSDPDQGSAAADGYMEDVIRVPRL